MSTSSRSCIRPQAPHAGNHALSAPARVFGAFILALAALSAAADEPSEWAGYRGPGVDGAAAGPLLLERGFSTGESLSRAPPPFPPRRAR